MSRASKKKKTSRVKKTYGTTVGDGGRLVNLTSLHEKWFKICQQLINCLFSFLATTTYSFYTFFRAMRFTFFLLNQFEHQKLNQTTPYIRRRLIEFMVFNSAFGRWLSLNSAYFIMITIYFLRSLKKVSRQHPLKRNIPWGIFNGLFLETGNACLKLFTVITENILWSSCNRHH